MSPEIVARSRRLTVTKSDAAIYVVKTDCESLELVIGWSLFTAVMAFCALGFGSVAILPFVAHLRNSGRSGDLGGAIGFCLAFGFMAALAGGVAWGAYRLAIRGHDGQRLTIDLQAGLLRVTIGSREWQKFSASSAREVCLQKFSKGVDAFALLIRIRLPYEQVAFSGDGCISIQECQLGYPMHQHHAELAIAGQTIADILKVPFTAEAF